MCKSCAAAALEAGELNLAMKISIVRKGGKKGNGALPESRFNRKLRYIMCKGSFDV